MSSQSTPESSSDSSSTLSSSSTTTTKSKVPVNCTKAFDAVYYCYSPVHQAREYYRTGQLDDCKGRLRRFRLCALSRLRPQANSEQMYEEEEIKQNQKLPKAQPVWQIREEYLERVEEFDRMEAIKQGNTTDENTQTAWWL